MPNLPRVTVLLATYNGARYLKTQLDSIVQQKDVQTHIIASDDGSTDDTQHILKQYQTDILDGPQKGFAANFFHLFQHANQDSEYYAFSDQDDLWEADKLLRATDWLKTIPENKPALYCARTLLVDEALNPIGYSPLFQKPPNFLNALVQNIAGGNTMVLNQAAFKLLRQTNNKHGVFAHDWWTYLLISGAGGEIFYDPKPALHYRQHGGNLLGNNMSLRARFSRVRMLFEGNLKNWVNRNNNNLLEFSHLLTPENQRILKAFEASRSKTCVPKLIRILQLGIHRQTKLTQMGLLIGALCNKI